MSRTGRFEKGAMMTSTDRTSTNLDAGIAHAASEIARTDTKAGLLLTLDGLLVAALSFLGTDVHGLALILAVAGAIALVGGVILALFVIRPRLSGRAIDDRSSFAYFATADEAGLADAMATDRRPARLQALSRLVLRKMRMLALAGDLSLAAVILIAAAILTR
ncbi:Pycsar system effector family protein [Streptomyces sp. NPDC086796]|uniref:Pycsar system effector family protein n=1 Tax=Streptomyces sp. NPDC086796 TaxID=3365760 RepID=UPI0037FDE9C3